jgi:hypothetical protein
MTPRMVSPMHISTDAMDVHTWLVFAIALGPVLFMMVVVAIRVRQDFREEAARLSGEGDSTPEPAVDVGWPHARALASPDPPAPSTAALPGCDTDDRRT